MFDTGLSGSVAMVSGASRGIGRVVAERLAGEGVALSLCSRTTSDLGAAAAVVVGSLPGASLGARLSRRAPVGFLRILLGAMIALAALRVWIDVLR